MEAVKHAATFVVKDLLGGVLYCIPWWYGKGRKAIQTMLFDHIRGFARNLHLGTLGKFLFTPMWGMTDWQSRLISIPVRIGQFVILLTVAIFYTVGLLLVLLVWLLFPVFVVYNLVYQLGIVPLNIYEYL